MDGGHDHGAEPHGSHDHGHGGRVRRLLGLEAPHSHDAADKVDDALSSSADGIRALKVSLAALGVTAALQAVVVVASNSVALLGDTLHNLADALTAIPLWFAFSIGRRPRDRSHTYGYGRAEDIAGIAIVVAIALSAGLAGYESFRRLLDPEPVSRVGIVMAAAVIGFVGNEWVAQYRIRVGRRIGSAALVADGLHARTDGFTSLAVLFGAIGVALGLERADALVGLAITAAILVVLRGAARDVYRRLMDAVDPALVERAQRAVESVPGVERVGDLRIRWIGHQLRAEVEVEVDPTLTVVEGHDVAERAHHALLHDVPRLTSAIVHFSPVDGAGVDHHAETAHHFGRGG